MADLFDQLSELNDEITSKKESMRILLRDYITRIINEQDETLINAYDLIQNGKDRFVEGEVITSEFKELFTICDLYMRYRETVDIQEYIKIKLELLEISKKIHDRTLIRFDDYVTSLVNIKIFEEEMK